MQERKGQKMDKKVFLPIPDWAVVHSEGKTPTQVAEDGVSVESRAVNETDAKRDAEMFIKELENFLLPALAFPSYNCPSCHDGHSFAPAPIKVCGAELSDLNAREKTVYVCPSCGYKVAMKEYFTQTIVVFNGRSVLNIIIDAVKTGICDAVEDILVVCCDDDRIEPPPEYKNIAVSNFVAEFGHHYVIIANGGTTSQLLPVLKKVMESKTMFDVYNLQRDSVTKVW